MKRTKKKIASELRSEEGFYDVIKLFDKDTTLFDCIPDNWFVDEDKSSCFWPPSNKGRNVAIRALKREKPDDSWERYNCAVVREGFVTYSCGQAVVREKCAQKYNTSSAEEHENAAKFRRLHPGLSLSVSGSFEDVFKKKKSIESSGQKNKFATDRTSKNTSAADVSSKNDSQINLESQIATSTEETLSSMALDRAHHSNISKGHAKSSSLKLQSKRGATVLHEMESSLEETEDAISSPAKHQRSEGAISPSLNHGENSSHQKISAVLDQVDRRSCSQELEGSGASNHSCLSEGRRSRSRSASRQSHSSNYSQRPASIKSPSTNHRRGCSQESAVSSASSTISSVRHRNRSSPRQNCSSSCHSRIFMIKVMKEIHELKKTIYKNHQENDRRLTRMEVTTNKTLVRLGDITRLTTEQSRDSDDDYNGRGYAQSYGESSRSQRYEDVQFGDESSRRQRLEDFSGSSRRQRSEGCSSGHQRRGNFGGSSERQRRDDIGDSSRRQPSEEAKSQSGGNLRGFVNPNDQRMCALPISSLSELTAANRLLMNRNFLNYLVNREKEFCAPGRNTTTNVVITTYLKRFVSLRVRSLLTLKELQNDQGMTLYSDFHYVYTFLIEVAQEGYKSCKKSLPEKEANEALRIVWGRTKQMLNDEQKKRK